VVLIAENSRFYSIGTSFFRQRKLYFEMKYNRVFATIAVLTIPILTNPILDALQSRASFFMSYFKDLLLGILVEISTTAEESVDP